MVGRSVLTCQPLASSFIYSRPPPNALVTGPVSPVMTSVSPFLFFREGGGGEGARRVSVPRMPQPIKDRSGGCRVPQESRRCIRRPLFRFPLKAVLRSSAPRSSTLNAVIPREALFPSRWGRSSTGARSRRSGALFFFLLFFNFIPFFYFFVLLHSVMSCCDEHTQRRERGAPDTRKTCRV